MCSGVCLCAFMCVFVYVCVGEGSREESAGSLGVIYWHTELVLDLERQGLRKKLVSSNLLCTPKLLIILILPKIKFLKV